MRLLTGTHSQIYDLPVIMQSVVMHWIFVLGAQPRDVRMLAFSRNRCSKVRIVVTVIMIVMFMRAVGVVMSVHHTGK